MLTEDRIKSDIHYVNETLLKSLIDYKHGHSSYLPDGSVSQYIQALQSEDEINNAIIHLYPYVNSSTQHKFMTDFLVAVVQEIQSKEPGASLVWNVAETRYGVLTELEHIFNKVIVTLKNEGYVEPRSHMRGVITEVFLLKPKSSIVYRLEGS